MIPGEEAGLLVPVFAALALVAFLLAIWSGRWGVWVTGYLLVVLALVVALLADRGPPEHESLEDALGDARAQHPEGFGVHPVSTRIRTGRRT